MRRNDTCEQFAAELWVLGTKSTLIAVFWWHAPETRSSSSLSRKRRLKCTARQPLMQMGGTCGQILQTIRPIRIFAGNISPASKRTHRLRYLVLKLLQVRFTN